MVNTLFAAPNERKRIGRKTIETFSSLKRFQRRELYSEDHLSFPNTTEYSRRLKRKRNANCGFKRHAFSRTKLKVNFLKQTLHERHRTSVSIFGKRLLKRCITSARKPFIIIVRNYKSIYIGKYISLSLAILLTKLRSSLNLSIFFVL